jgi:hypothetical protein
MGLFTEYSDLRLAATRTQLLRRSQTTHRPTHDGDTVPMGRGHDRLTSGFYGNGLYGTDVRGILDLRPQRVIWIRNEYERALVIE